MSAARKSARRVQQLHLDVADHHDGPRPIKSAIGTVLRGLLPDVSEAGVLSELSGPERRDLYDLAGLSPLHRAELEDAVRQAIRRRYRRRAT